MSLFTQGESNGVRPTHPEREVPNNTGFEVEDHRGDGAAEYQALRVCFINVQIFPTNVLHHKNGSIIKLINNNHVHCLGMTEMNIYWPSISTQQQLHERIREWFESTVLAASYTWHNMKVSNQQGGTAIIICNQLARRSFVRY